MKDNLSRVLSIAIFVMASMLSREARAQLPSLISANPATPVAGESMSIKFDRPVDLTGDIQLLVRFTSEESTTVTILAGHNTVSMTVPEDASQVLIQDPSGTSADFAAAVVPPNLHLIEPRELAFRLPVLLLAATR